MHQRYTRSTALRELGFVAGAIAFAFPIYILVTGMLKSKPEALSDPLALPEDWLVSNFGAAWDASGGPGRTSISDGLVNTTVITLSSVVVLILIASLVGYFIARRNSKLSGGVLVFFLIGLVVPSQLSLVPLFWMLRQLGLLGTHLAVIAIYAGLLMPLSVFLYAGFIRKVPVELEESAMMDGAGRLKIFYSVVFPLLRPITATVGIVTGLIVWNQFFIPLVVLGGSDKGTLPLVIYSFVGDAGFPDWPLAFSTILMAIAPMIIVFIFAQKYMVEGLSGGLRG